jgi:hypothetical protein
MMRSAGREDKSPIECYSALLQPEYYIQPSRTGGKHLGGRSTATVGADRYPSACGSYNTAAADLTLLRRPQLTQLIWNQVVVIEVAPRPLEVGQRPDDRMLCLLEVLARVLARRRVATAHVAAALAQAKRDPVLAGAQAFFAAVRVRTGAADLIGMSAVYGHNFSFSSD